MLPVRAAGAVLVVLQLHQGDLGTVGQPRDRPGVRVGLLELVDAAVDQHLLELLGRGLAVQVLGERGPVERGDQPEQLLREVGVGTRRGDTGVHGLAARGAERSLVDRLELAADGEQLRLPLPAVVDPVEPAVVQLVEHPQRQVQVVVGQRRGRAGCRACGSHGRGVEHDLAGEYVDEVGAQRAAGCGQVHGHSWCRYGSHRRYPSSRPSCRRPLRVAPRGLAPRGSRIWSSGVESGSSGSQRRTILDLPGGRKVSVVGRRLGSWRR